MKKKRKFQEGVARFFNPQKSGTNAEYFSFVPVLTKQRE